MVGPQVGDFHVKAFRFQVGVQSVGKLLQVAGVIILLRQEKASALQIGKVQLSLFIGFGLENHIWNGKGETVGVDGAASFFLPAGLGIADGGWDGIHGLPNQIKTHQMVFPSVSFLRLGQGDLTEQSQQDNGNQNQNACPKPFIHRPPPIVRRSAGYLPRHS